VPGRTPEHLDKKIEAREVKVATLGALFPPVLTLVEDARPFHSEFLKGGCSDLQTAFSRPFLP